MKNIKKKWRKQTLIIDFRPAQDLKHNGVTKSTFNWTKELIRISKKDEPIIIWTNSRNTKPNLPFQKSNVQHIHTQHSNLYLQILWLFNARKTLETILKLKTKYILFSPDIRAIKTGSKCLRRIQYFHDIAFIKQKGSLNLQTKLWFDLSKPKRLFKKADLILTNSRFSQSELKQNYGQQKIKIIHPSLPKKLSSKKHKHPKNFHLLISTLQKRKNINSIIQKFTNSKHNLLIVGSKEKMYKKYPVIKNQSNIKILTNISDQQKHYLIKNCQATIYPSLYEGFGIPILESIRLQKPCLTFLISPFTELFENQITDIKHLFSIEKYNKPTKQNIYSLKQEVRKLKKYIYSLD